VVCGVVKVVVFVWGMVGGFRLPGRRRGYGGGRVEGYL
jgi:hypothetical protein